MRKLFAYVLCLILGISILDAEVRHPRVSEEIPMRDGMKLPTDIYLPHENSRNLPVILLRSPNGREWHYSKIADLVHAGYAVAIQDTRNFLDAAGSTIPFVTDGWGSLQDGYDTIEWLAKSEYCNGKVATYGVSALGITQNLLAPSNPPSLVCQHIGMAVSSIYDHAIFYGGQLRKQQVEGWLGSYASDPAVLKQVIELGRSDRFRALLNVANVADQVKTPAIYHGGWFDTFLRGTIDGFEARQKHGGEGAKGNQKLIVGPWTHHWPDQVDLGDFTVPEQGRQHPIDFSAKRWFDYHLKGDRNGIDEIPAVTYYVMGPFDGSESSGNVWRHADTWPVPSQKTAFYLDSGERLIEAKAPPRQTSVSYTHDPSRPVPTLGGGNLFLRAGPVDQRPIEKRDDVLIFTTNPLKEDIEITGNLEAIIALSTDVEDTDIAIRISDVYPDGRSILISDGIQRLAADNGPCRPSGVHHEPCEVEIDLGSTSIVFAKGHRIRISISGSNFPRFNVNSNRESSTDTNSGPVIAHNRVHLGGIGGSRILLPVTRRGDKYVDRALSHHTPLEKTPKIASEST